MSLNARTALSAEQLGPVLDAAADRSPVSGLTHGFYKYPARFSPTFAGITIEQLSAPGDVVLDPFMGGGTTVVEARSRGRLAIGTDTSSLALFLARVKATPLSDPEMAEVSSWIARQAEDIRLADAPLLRGTVSDEQIRNFSGTSTWRIRKFLELALDDLESIPSAAAQRLARAVLLCTAQWAVDTRRHPKDTTSFRARLIKNFDDMAFGLRAFAEAAGAADRAVAIRGRRRILEQRRAEDLGAVSAIRAWEPPRLIVTSPPYPGVHVLYHRWQVDGGKETPAPFWIAGVEDGAAAESYTLAPRHNLDRYFERHETAFKGLAEISDERTIVVQLIAFSDPGEQLERYLQSMERAGFGEALNREAEPDGRFWRDVPSRRWYSERRGATPASKELVLFHQLR